MSLGRNSRCNSRSPFPQYRPCCEILASKSAAIGECHDQGVNRELPAGSRPHGESDSVELGNGGFPIESVTGVGPVERKAGTLDS